MFLQRKLIKQERGGKDLFIFLSLPPAVSRVTIKSRESGICRSMLLCLCSTSFFFVALALFLCSFIFYFYLIFIINIKLWIFGPLWEGLVRSGRIHTAKVLCSLTVLLPAQKQLYIYNITLLYAVNCSIFLNSLPRLILLSHIVKHQVTHLFFLFLFFFLHATSRSLSLYGSLLCCEILM